MEQTVMTSRPISFRAAAILGGFSLLLVSCEQNFNLSRARPDVDPNDVHQGQVGDCWLLSTCAALAKKEELLFRVIDPKQVPGQKSIH